MKLTPIKLSMIVAAAVAAGTAMATPFGTNVTIYDQNSAGTGWYGPHEDQETETNPNTVTSQQWDLEGMFLSGSTLTLVGGYDFKNGVNWSDGHNYKSGDIFIDVDGDAKYGSTNPDPYATGYSPVGGPTTTNVYGYDYVLDLDFSTMKYNVIKLTAGSVVSRVVDVASSNPWTYVSGGTSVLTDVGFGYTAGLTNADTGFDGDSTNFTGYSTGSNQHYALSVDLAFIAGKTATIHYTMECGNDDLMGLARSPEITTFNVPDAGSTVLMFGLALAGLAGFRRKLVR